MICEDQDSFKEEYTIYVTQDVFDDFKSKEHQKEQPIKLQLEQYLYKNYPDLNQKQIYALLSFNQSNFQHKSFQNHSNGNNILDGYITFGSMTSINFLDLIIKPNDYQIHNVEAIQGLLVDEPKLSVKNSLLQSNFIMFLKFLKCQNRFLPINVIQRLLKFVWLPPNTIMDIGSIKRIYVSLFSNDDRNIINLNDNFIIAKNIKMKILNDKPISVIMQEQGIELTTYNIKNFIRDNYRDLIGLREQNSYLLFQALQAQDEEQIRIFTHFIYNIIEEKVYKIIWSQNQIAQFGSGQLIQHFYRIPTFQQIDNYQFYLDYKNNKWLIYDGKYSSQQQSKYGTWKMVGDQHRTLQKGEKIRIENSYYTLNNDPGNQPISFNIDTIKLIDLLKLPNENLQQKYANPQQKIQPLNQSTLYPQSMHLPCLDNEYQDYMKCDYFKNKFEKNIAKEVKEARQGEQRKSQANFLKKSKTVE